jgi:hypothetical protein
MREDLLARAMKDLNIDPSTPPDEVLKLLKAHNLKKSAKPKVRHPIVVASLKHHKARLALSLPHLKDKQNGK